MIKQYIESSIAVKKSILENDQIIADIETAIEMIKNCFENSKKILIAGNGGSAADAQHFSAEIVGRYKKERRGYPAIALTTDTSVITAWSNDYGYDSLFSRQIEALGNAEDVFIGISTSGNSKNIIEAINLCNAKNMRSICLLGKDGGQLKNLGDINIIVPSDDTARIQEAHIMIIHILCEEVEKIFT